jgi:hypothetical protein
MLEDYAPSFSSTGLTLVCKIGYREHIQLWGGGGEGLLIIRYDIKYRSKGGIGEGGLEKKGCAIVKKRQYRRK